MDEFIWTEKYRPKTVSECILPQYLKDTFQQFVNQKNLPNLLLYGPAGTGKTTISRAVIDEMGSDYLFVPSSEDRGIDLFRHKIRNYASSVSMNGARKYVILDEADGLTPDAQQAFRGTIEEFSVNTGFILTCNFPAKLFEPIRSRFSAIDFRLKREDRPAIATQFHRRIKEILGKEGIPFTEEVLIKIIQKYFPDFRKTLNELQRYSAEGNGKIDIGILVNLTEISIKELMGYLKEKDFSRARKWVTQNSDQDMALLYRNIYDGLYDYLDPASIPEVILILAKYGYQNGFCADQEVNLAAAVVEIMITAQFK